MFQRIVVAVSDSAGAEGLGAATAELTASREAEVLFVHVAECNVCCGAQDHPALHAHERDILEQLVADLTGRGISSRGEQRMTATGRVDENMLDAAAEFRADLLIVPASRPGRLSGRAQRRVIDQLVRGADCPVLVLPRPAVGRRRGSGDLLALEQEVEA